MNSYDLYTKTRPVNLFFMVAVPGGISMIASSLWGIFDSIFVGNYLGETALAALNLAFPFVLICFSLSDLIGVGSSVPISIALGKQEREEADNYFTCACIAIVLLGALSGVVLYFAAPTILRVMGADEQLTALGVTYIRVYALFAPATSIIFSLDNFLRICGKIKLSMGLNILMSVLILGLEYLCIVVLDMGIGGSPAAVSLGMTVCAAAALIPFLGKKLSLRFCRPRFSFQILGQFFYSGCPNFLSNTAARITSIVINMVLLRMGGAGAVAVYGILMSAGDIVQQLLYGTCDSLQPALGYNWGAGQTGRVKSIIRCCLAAGAAISISGMVLMLAFPEGIAAMFLQEGDSGVLTMAVHALRLYSLTNLTRWFPFGVQGFLIALNKPMPATVLSVCNTFVLPLLLLAVLYPMGLDGIWLNTPITSLLVSVFALVLLRRMIRQINQGL